MRSPNSYIAIYLDMQFINDYISSTRDATKNRLQDTQDPATVYHDVNYQKMTKDLPQDQN